MRRRLLTLVVLGCTLAACDTGDGRRMDPPTEPPPPTPTPTTIAPVGLEPDP